MVPALYSCMHAAHAQVKVSQRNNGIKKGPWDCDEDAILKAYVQEYGPKNWSRVRIRSGLARCGKSCRLRWVNYLNPDIRRGNFTPEEEDVIIRFHAKLGNRWAKIAAELPGRTDHEIKNHWHAHLKKKTQRICMATNSNNNQQQYLETNSSSATPNEGFFAKSTYRAVIATATGIGHKDVPSNTTPCLVNSYVDDDLGRCLQEELSNLQVLNYEDRGLFSSDQDGGFSNQQGDFNNLDHVLLPFSYDYQYHPHLYTHYHNNYESAAYNGHSSAAPAPVVKPLPGFMSVSLHHESENPDEDVLYFKNPTESNNVDDAISNILYQLNSSDLLPTTIMDDYGQHYQNFHSAVVAFGESELLRNVVPWPATLCI